MTTMDELAWWPDVDRGGGRRASLLPTGREPLEIMQERVGGTSKVVRVWVGTCMRYRAHQTDGETVGTVLEAAALFQQYGIEPPYYL